MKWFGLAPGALREQVAVRPRRLAPSPENSQGWEEKPLLPRRQPRA